jgi:photosystem II stability/assembly factor-like uncharacterized protein
MFSSKINKLVLLAIVLLLSSGCTLSLGQSKSNDLADGGVFRSADGGLTWSQQILIPSVTGAPGSIAGVSSLDMVMDPSDNKALYLATLNKGILYSYDQANTWQIVRNSNISKKTILTLAVDPKNKCQLYSVSGNKLFKSEDCGRNWIESYSDNKQDLVIVSLKIDNYDSSKIYFVTDRGDVIKSEDFGKSWRTIINIKRSIKRIVIDPTDSRIIFIATNRGEIYRSMDSGSNWTELKDNFKKFNFDRSFRDLVAIPSLNGAYLLATKYGLLKTVNYGDDWTEIKLLTPKKEAVINSVAIDYKNPNLIYYITDSTFYRSQDGGQNWSSNELPTTRRGWRLLADPLQEGLLYLALRQD